MRQERPSTPAANDVEDVVEDLAQGVYARPTVGLWSGQMGL